MQRSHRGAKESGDPVVCRQAGAGRGQACMRQHEAGRNATLQPSATPSAPLAAGRRRGWRRRTHTSAAHAHAPEVPRMVMVEARCRLRALRRAQSELMRGISSSSGIIMTCGADATGRHETGFRPSILLYGAHPCVAACIFLRPTHLMIKAKYKERKGLRDAGCRGQGAGGNGAQTEAEARQRWALGAGQAQASRHCLAPPTQHVAH